MGVDGLQKDWQTSLPIKPLSPEEIHFLRIHTLQDITPAFSSSKRSSVNDFVIEILTSLSVQLAATCIEAASSASEANHSNRQPASSSSTGSKTSQDPSLRHMTKVTSHKMEALAFKTSLKALQSELTSAGVDKEFTSKLTTSIAAGVKTGVFLNKVSEQGLVAASFDLARDTIVKAVTEIPAKNLFTMMSCTNPAGLAANVSLVIVETFKPIELAPAWQDLPPPPKWVIDALQQMPPSSGIPDLMLSVPAIRQAN